MVTIIPFQANHLAALNLQPAQAYMLPYIERADYTVALESSGPAYSALADGRIIACAGVAEIWPGRGAAWALLANSGPCHFGTVHRAVCRFLDGCGIRRVEAYVDPEFDAARRWMRLLGFRLETPDPMRAFGDDGRDMLLYARTR